MEYNHKAEERKLYFRYFRIWMILAVLAVVIFCGFLLFHEEEEPVRPERNNNQSPVQRVYDYAGVLTVSEVEMLESLIAQCEEQSCCDIVLVTMNQEVGESDYEWEQSMVNISDNFYDQYAFGYDQPHGDGALLLDNYYHQGQADSQAGAWLSTSGKLEYAIGSSEETKVFQAMDEGFELSAADGYAEAIRKIAYYGMDDDDSVQLPWWLVLIVPMVISLIYAGANMKQTPGVDTTSPTTYVPGGKPTIKEQKDDFIRKTVAKVKIETESSGSRGGGSYGHHTSSGGYSHGGGGHRR